MIEFFYSSYSKLIHFLVLSAGIVVLGRSCSKCKCHGAKAIKDEEDENKRLAASKGYMRTRLPWLNKGSGFTQAERDELKLNGLFPGGEPLSLEVKVDAAINEMRQRSTPLEKYIFLHTIQDSDETLFYAVLIKYMFEVVPLVYTPVVGEACQKWSRITRHLPRGIYLSLKDIGRVREILANHVQDEVDVIVFTDGERILGLGDLGANGMGIPVGKLALYTACAGIHPRKCLPVHIDAGTNNEKLLADPAYLGLRQQRERGPSYDALVDEFINGAKEVFGKHVLLQFEDFGNTNAFRLLHRYEDNACTFNDDIQGTASVALAGLISSLPLTGKAQLADHTYLFYGAGEAGVGIADLIATAIHLQTHCTFEEARNRIWLVDSRGLITSARQNLEEHKLHYAHTLTATAPEVGVKGSPDFALRNAIELVRPTVLIGVSAQGSTFTRPVVTRMAELSENPVIFALSNPTSKSECTAEEAYKWSNGKAIFCSGSPFDPVTLDNGVVKVPGQGNNAFIFPGVGLGVVVSGAQRIINTDFYLAAKSLASQVTQEDLATGCIYPPFDRIREVSAKIAADVAEEMFVSKRALKPRPPGDLVSYCRSAMYVPSYENL